MRRRSASLLAAAIVTGLLVATGAHAQDLPSAPDPPQIRLPGGPDPAPAPPPPPAPAPSQAAPPAPAPAPPASRPAPAPRPSAPRATPPSSPPSGPRSGPASGRTIAPAPSRPAAARARTAAAQRRAAAQQRAAAARRAEAQRRAAERRAAARREAERLRHERVLRQEALAAQGESLAASPPEERTSIGTGVLAGAGIVLALPLAMLAGVRLWRRRRGRDPPASGGARRRRQHEPSVLPMHAEAATTQAREEGGVSLRRGVTTGIGWKALSTMTVQVTRIVVAVMLARLLTPAEFGLAATVLVLAALAIILVDPALGTALIHRPTITERDRSTVFWTSFAIGLVSAAGVVAASEPLARFFGEPELRPLFAVFALTFVLSGLQTTHATLMTRKMRFRSLEIRMIVATLAGGAVGITTAALGAGAWAVIWQSLTMSAVSTVLLWAFSPWRPRFRFSLTSLRELGGTGLKAYGTNLLWFANGNTDKVLIARVLGPATLGPYALAYNLMLFPISRIASPVHSVLFPALSRIQHQTARVARIWLRADRMVAAAAVPAMLGVIAVAPDLVPVVLGDRWREAVTVIQVLAVVGLVQALQIVGGSTLYALGRFGTVLRFTAVSVAANIAAFATGIHWGILGVAAAYAVATAALFPVFITLVARGVATPLRAWARTLWGVVEAGLVMLACVTAARLLLVAQGVSAEARLPLLIALGAAVYAGLCAVRAPEVLRELRALRRRGDAGPVPRATPAPSGSGNP